MDTVIWMDLIDFINSFEFMNQQFIGFLSTFPVPIKSTSRYSFYSEIQSGSVLADFVTLIFGAEPLTES